MGAARDLPVDRRAAIRTGVALLLGASAAPVIGALGGCAAADPRPIDYGRDQCAFCRMVVSEPRFAASLLTAAGRTLVFDSIECLASFTILHRATGERAPRSSWVSVDERPGRLVLAQEARYSRDSGSPSPMGKGIRAFAPTDAGTRASGKLLAWPDVLALVEREGLTRGVALRRVRRGLLLALAASCAAASGATAPVVRAQSAERPQIVVSPTGPLRSIGTAIARAPRGAHIRIMPGVYREPTIVVDRPLTIEGVGVAVLDGEGRRQIMTITSDSVTVRHLTFRDVGTSHREDRSAIRIIEASHCAIEDNRIERAFFGIYLARVSDCRIERNTLVGAPSTEVGSGNGIHLWTANNVSIVGNHVRGHRDGIYFEFVHDSDVERNVSEENERYGLHFMFSDDCRYRGNVFRHNGAGVAVMYTRRVEMVGNLFEWNEGAATYGLLLKEISDARLEGNRFTRNTTALLADGTTRLTASHNRFADNGWAIRLDANAQNGHITGNDFLRNSFDVTTNGRSADTILEGNYWDAYAGYDLGHDGYGDVPHRPVRLFSLLVARNDPALILLRSTFVALLDVAERVVPTLTPETLADHRPAMRLVNGALR
jgi:nitrous oxidase accessory protein